MDTAAASSSTPLRRAVYGGLLSSICATGGWLAWLFGRAVLEDWTALFGPMVGAFLGLVVHAAEHYREVAHFEKHGGTWPEGETKEAPPGRFSEGLGRSVLLVGLAFVALTCEHVLGELMKDYLVPFAASLAALFPVGAALSLVFGETSDEKGFFPRLGRGLIAGLLAGAIASAAQGAIGRTVDYGGLFGWWIVLCLGLSFATGVRPLGPGRALLGMSIAIGVVAFYCLPWPDRLAKSVPIPQIRVPLQVVGSAVGGALDSPDMPAQFWMNAERKEEERKARLAAGRGETYRTPEESPVGLWLAGLIGYKPFHHREIFRPIGSVPDLAEMGSSLRQGIDRLKPPSPERFEATAADWRRDQLGGELVKGWDSSLVRSWLVMTLFAFGLGLAPLVEEELRPKDYPSSRTARNDRLLASYLAVFVVISCLLLRFVPSLTH